MSIMFFFKDLISIRATFAMVGANATVEPLMGQRFKPMGGTIMGMCMALELKKSLACANYYQR